MLISWASTQLKEKRLRYFSRFRNLKYHFRSVNLEKIREYQYQLTGVRHLPWIRLVQASWQYGASFEDYYAFRFFEKQSTERRRYLTTSLCFDLDLQLNHIEKRHILKDKLSCSHHFQDLLGRPVWTFKDLTNQPLSTSAPKLVAKYRWGQLGKGIHFFPAASTWAETLHLLKNTLQNLDDFVFEPYLEQHSDLHRLNPGSVNTLQIITCLQGCDVFILNCILRMGIGEGTDHFSNGGLAIWVDEDGSMPRPAVNKEPFFQGVWLHPLTQESLKDLVIPYFEEAKNLAKAAALRTPDLRTVSWDIAISPEGPCLLEGNHNWSCKTSQMPRGKGLREQAAKVSDMYRIYK